jgi:hypothetical protein
MFKKKKLLCLLLAMFITFSSTAYIEGQDKDKEDEGWIAQEETIRQA